MKSLMYWSSDSLIDLQSAQNFEEVLRIARNVTSEAVRVTGERPWMVSGPISERGGYRNKAKNLQAFNQTIYKLDGLDYILFNQIPMEQRVDQIYSWSWDTDPVSGIYLPLLDAHQLGGLFVMDSYQTSRGACREVARAQQHDLPIHYLRHDFHLDAHPDLVNTVQHHVRK